MKTNTFFAFLKNNSRTTKKASAYHRLGTPDLSHRTYYNRRLLSSFKTKTFPLISLLQIDTIIV